MKRKKAILWIIFAVFAIFLIWLAVARCGGSSKKDAAAAKDSVINGPTMLTQLKSCSRLSTAEVKVHKIITHDDEMKLSGKLLGKELSLNIPAGKRKVAIPLYATVKASINLSKISDNDIVKTGDKIEIFLPHPEVEITETHIDHEGIKQFVAFTRSNFSDEELQKYELEGRKSIEASLPNLGVEEMAKESAARQLVPIIQKFGYKDSDITISFRKNEKSSTIFRQAE